MSLTFHRLIAALGLFGLTFMVGIVPVILIKLWINRKKCIGLSVPGNTDTVDITSHKNGQYVVQLLLFFGGGVLLSTCFIHLIPEVRYNYYKYSHHDDHFHCKLQDNQSGGSENNSSIHNKRENKSNCSYGHNLKYSQDCQHNLNHNNDHNNHHGHSHGYYSGENASQNGSFNSTTSSSDHDHKHSHSHDIPFIELAICGGFFLIYFLEVLIHFFIGDHTHHNHSSKNEVSHLNASSSCSSTSKNNLILNQQTSSTQLIARAKSMEFKNGFDNFGADLKNEINSSGHQTCYHSCFDTSEINFSNVYQANTFTIPFSVRFIRGFVTILAFSAHSIFDGVAIGLQETPTQLWTIFFAISIHKLVVAFAIGMELFEKVKTLTLTTFHMIIFSLTSPTGIIIVIISEQEFNEKESPFITLLSAIATGTILYILFFEILQNENSTKVSKFIQFLSVLTGFIVMTAIVLTIQH